ncbi:MAG: Ser/Thr protein kinase RdoA (MazF antagonist) [Bradymonadia bacterium]|jgi:Ser/Thr protein kinase RdoA (MazF antagonist)
MQVDDPKVDAPRAVVVFHWIDGRAIHSKPLSKHYAELGRLTARLHEFSRALRIERMSALEEREGCRLPIHADLHIGNGFARPDGMAIIDFDDMRLAHPLSDAGVTIGAARGPLRNAYIEGCREIATFSAEWERLLPVYGLTRWLTIVGWAAARAGQIAILRKHLPYYVARMTLYSRALVHDDAEAYAAAFEVPPPK